MENLRDYWSAIEQIEQEKRVLESSEYFHLGREVSTGLCLLKAGKVKQLLNRIRLSRRSKETRKLYNYDFTHEKVISYDDVDTSNLGIITVYTAVFGKYDRIPQPLIFLEGVHYVVYTDHPDLLSDYDPRIEIRTIPDTLLKKGPILANRYLKFHPSEFFSESSFAIYVDGNVRTISDVRVWSAAALSSTGLAMHRHKDRDCAYDEAKVCISLGRGNSELIHEQMRHYRETGFPQHFGLNEATVIVSNLQNPVSTKLLDAWWSEFCRFGSMRDQLSLSPVLWKNGYEITDVGNLGYGVADDLKIELLPHA